MDRRTHTQDNYSNPHACAPRDECIIATLFALFFRAIHLLLTDCLESLLVWLVLCVAPISPERVYFGLQFVDFPKNLQFKSYGVKNPIANNSLRAENMDVAI